MEKFKIDYSNPNELELITKLTTLEDIDYVYDRLEYRVKYPKSLKLITFWYVYIFKWYRKIYYQFTEKYIIPVYVFISLFKKKTKETKKKYKKGIKIDSDNYTFDLSDVL